MRFYTLPVDAPDGAPLEPFPHDSDSVVAKPLMEHVAVRKTKLQRTVRDILNDGQCVVVKDRWVVPEQVSASVDGEATTVHSTELAWCTRQTSDEHQHEFDIEARIYGHEQPVKVSKQVRIVRGWERNMKTHAMGQLINTKYGEIPMQHLVIRTPSPGRTEYWLPLEHSPRYGEIMNDPTFVPDGETIRREGVEPITGEDRFLELVSSSQIATKG